MEASNFLKKLKLFYALLMILSASRENSGSVKNYWSKACIYPALIWEIFSRYEPLSFGGIMCMYWNFTVHLVTVYYGSPHWCGSFWYRTDCSTVQTVLLGAVHSMYWPAQLPGRSSVISGELQAGGNSICLCLTGVLLWPPKRPIWTACAHFRESYPIDVLHFYFNILCLLLLKVSISVDLCLPFITIFPLWPVYMF